ncbi:uncharacterized protein LOC122248496 [Penaeus japonicus]|uniref:uncharacterized protein LOC122248496 n=1 Tax=Penaeus japonicus TaxID=27405 RepID=UPI001C70D42E|nr:uncharacterized protein LOC122248496 [Penaeus japonicus]
MAAVRVAPRLLVLLVSCSFPGHPWAHPYPLSIEETPDLHRSTSDSVQQKRGLADSGQLSPDSVRQNSYTILPISVPVQLNLKAVPSTKEPNYLSQGPGFPILNQESRSIQPSRYINLSNAGSSRDETVEGVSSQGLNLTAFSQHGGLPNTSQGYARKSANQIPITANPAVKDKGTGRLSYSDTARVPESQSGTTDQSDVITNLHVAQITDFRSPKIPDQTPIVSDEGSANLVGLDAVSSPQLPVLPSFRATRLIDLGSAKLIDTKSESKPEDLKDVTISSIRLTDLGSGSGITYLGSVKASDLGLIETGDPENVRAGDPGFAPETNLGYNQPDDFKSNSASDLGSVQANDLGFIQSSGLESTKARELDSVQPGGTGSARVNELGPTRLIDLGSVKVLDRGAKPSDLGSIAGSDLISAKLSNERITAGAPSGPTKVVETESPKVSYLGTVKLADLRPTIENDQAIDQETEGETAPHSTDYAQGTIETSKEYDLDILQPFSSREDQDSFSEIELDTSPFISLDSALFINLGPSSGDSSTASTEDLENSPLVDLISDTILEMVTKAPSDQNSRVPSLPGPTSDLFSKPFVIMGPGNMQDYPTSLLTSQISSSEPEKQISREFPFTEMSLDSQKDLESETEKVDDSIHGMGVNIDYRAPSLSLSPSTDLEDVSKVTSQQDLVSSRISEHSPFHGLGNPQSSAQGSDLQHVPAEHSSKLDHAPVDDRYFLSAQGNEPSGYTPSSNVAYALNPPEGETQQVILTQDSAINTDNGPASDVIYDLVYDSSSSDNFDYPTTFSRELKQNPVSNDPHGQEQTTMLKTEDLSADLFNSDGNPNHNKVSEAQDSNNLFQQDTISPNDLGPFHAASVEPDQGTTHRTTPVHSGKVTSQDFASYTAPRFFREIAHEPSLETHQTQGSLLGQSVLPDEQHYQVPVLKKDKLSVTESDNGQPSITGSQYNQLPITGENYDQSSILGSEYDKSSVTDSIYGPSLTTGSEIEQSSVLGSQYNQSPLTGERYSQSFATGSQYDQSQFLLSEYGQPSITESAYDQSLAIETPYDQLSQTEAQYDQSSATGLQNSQSTSITSNFAQSSIGSQNYQSPGTGSQQHQFLTTEPQYNLLPTNVPYLGQSSVAESQDGKSLITESQYEQSLLSGPQHVQTSAKESQKVKSPVITSQYVQSLTSGPQINQPLHGQSANDQVTITDSQYRESLSTGLQNDHLTVPTNHNSQPNDESDNLRYEYVQASDVHSNYAQPIDLELDHLQPREEGLNDLQPIVQGTNLAPGISQESDYGLEISTGDDYGLDKDIGLDYAREADQEFEYEVPNNSQITGTWTNNAQSDVPDYVYSTDLNYIQSPVSDYVQSTVPDYVQSTVPDYVQSTVSDDIQSPVSDYVQSTVSDDIQSPVSDYVQSTVSDNIQSPVSDYVQSTVSDNIQSPVSDYVQSTVSDDIQSPVSDYVQSTDLDYIQSPVSDYVQSTVSDNIQSPVSDYVQSTVSDNIQSPVSDYVQSTVPDYVQSPVSDYDQSSFSDIQSPVSDYVQSTDLDYIQSPVSDYIQSTVSDNIQSPVSDYVQSTDLNYIQSPVSDYVQSTVNDFTQPIDQGSGNIKPTDNFGHTQPVDQELGSVPYINQISDYSQSDAILPYIQPVILLPELVHPRELGSEYSQSSHLESTAAQQPKTKTELDQVTDLKNNEVQADSKAEGKESEYVNDYTHANNLKASALGTEYIQPNDQATAEETGQPLSSDYRLTQSSAPAELGHESGLTNNLDFSQSVDLGYEPQDTHLNQQSHENSLPTPNLPFTSTNDFSDDTKYESEFGNSPSHNLDHEVTFTFTNNPPDFSISSSFGSQLKETDFQSPSDLEVFSALDLASHHTADLGIPLSEQIPAARSIPDSTLENQEQYLIQDNLKPTIKFDTDSPDFQENEEYSYDLENTSAAEVIPSTVNDAENEYVYGQGSTTDLKFPSSLLNSTTTDVDLRIYEHSISKKESNTAQEAKLSQTPAPTTGPTSNHYLGYTPTSTLGYTSVPTVKYSPSPLTYTPGPSVESASTPSPVVGSTPTPTPGYTPSVRGYTPALAFGYTSAITQGYTTPSTLGNTPTPAPRLTTVSDYSYNSQPGLGFTPKPILEYTLSPDIGRGPSPTIGYTPKPITGYTPPPGQGSISASTPRYSPVTTQSHTEEPGFVHTTPSVINHTPLVKKTDPRVPTVGYTPSAYPDVTPTPAPILENTLAPIQVYTTKTPRESATTPTHSQGHTLTPLQGQNVPALGVAQAREQDIPSTVSQRRRPSDERKNRNRNRNRDQLKPYVFAYSITDPRNGADFWPTEESDGSVVSGQYHVLLPDGRRQMVHYRADPVNGFVSEVEYLENHPPGLGDTPYHLPTAGDQIQSPSIISISRSKPPLELLSHLPTRAHAADGNPRKTTIEVPSVGSTGQEPTAGSPVYIEAAFV